MRKCSVGMIVVGALACACSPVESGDIVAVSGQQISQAAINCVDPPQTDGNPLFGLQLPNTTVYPSGPQDEEGYLIVSPAHFAPVTGDARFYGHPIVAVMNDAWIVNAPVETVAASVIDERAPGIALEQVAVQSLGMGFGLPGYYSQTYGNLDTDDYEPSRGSAASGGQFAFENAVRRFEFPKVRAQSSGSDATLTLWEMPNGITLAQCTSNEGVG